MPTTTASQIIYSAMRAARILLAPGRGPSTSDSSDALACLNDIVDEWSAKKACSWSTSFGVQTITPNYTPNMIGPGLVAPDFTTGTNARPVRIESANLILNSSTPSVELPLEIRDAAWWAANQVKALTSTIPTDLFYSPDVPSGSIYLWPVPTVAYGLRLELRNSFAPFATTASSVNAPPAAIVALNLTLAEQLSIYYPNSQPSPLLATKAQRARYAFEGNNIQSPRMGSTDPGAGGTRRRRGFNWATGMPS